MYGTATTHISLNETDEKKRCYPWEISLNHLSCFKNTYTLAFFDCCRVQLSEKEWIQKLQKVNGRGNGNELVCEAVPGQIKIFFGCRAGSTTPKDSNLSQAALDEFKRQLAVYGYVKTCNHQVLNTKLPTNMKMDTRDNTSMSLYWVVEGSKPIQCLDDDKRALKQYILDLKQQIIELDKKNIDQDQDQQFFKQEINDQYEKIIDQEQQIKALRQQLQ